MNGIRLLRLRTVQGTQGKTMPYTLGYARRLNEPRLT